MRAFEGINRIRLNVRYDTEKGQSGCFQDHVHCSRGCNPSQSWAVILQKGPYNTLTYNTPLFKCSWIYPFLPLVEIPWCMKAICGVSMNGVTTFQVLAAKYPEGTVAKRIRSNTNSPLDFFLFRPQYDIPATFQIPESAVNPSIIIDVRYNAYKEVCNPPCEWMLGPRPVSLGIRDNTAWVLWTISMALPDGKMYSHLPDYKG